MKIALTQMDIAWERPAENKKTCERLVKQASENDCHWIIFPELTLTGFTMHPERFGEELLEDSPTRQFFRSLSLNYSIDIAYGYIAANNGKYYNHLAFVQSGAAILEYDKIHPFSYGEESLHYTGGSRIAVSHIPILPTAGFAPDMSLPAETGGDNAKVLPQDNSIHISGFICYDLRFPEVFQIASGKAVVILVIANWPETRISHWYTLLQARAIENQCFIIGVNRTGDGGGLHYVPSSAAFSPYGERLTPDSSEELLYAEICPDLADRYRAEFPLKQDRTNSFSDFIRNIR